MLYSFCPNCRQGVNWRHAKAYYGFYAACCVWAFRARHTASGYFHVTRVEADTTNVIVISAVDPPTPEKPTGAA